VRPVGDEQGVGAGRQSGVDFIAARDVETQAVPFDQHRNVHGARPLRGRDEQHPEAELPQQRGHRLAVGDVEFPVRVHQARLLPLSRFSREREGPAKREGEGL
jgi:hypothetical protein